MKLMDRLKKEYWSKRWESIYYALENKAKKHGKDLSKAK